MVRWGQGAVLGSTNGHEIGEQPRQEEVVEQEPEPRLSLEE